MAANPNIAIDGPAGSGKSTVALMVAKELGFLCRYGCYVPGCNVEGSARRN